MTKVMTVLGPIAPSDLGFTSMHEHILTNCGLYGELTAKFLPEGFDSRFFPSGPDETIKMEDLNFLRHGGMGVSKDNWDLGDESLMTLEVGDFKTAGGGAILECSALGIRPDIAGLRRISEATGVHIVASTGFYAEEFIPRQYLQMSAAELDSHMKREIVEGIEGTDIKAGQIKSAVNFFSDVGKTFLQAAACTSNDTGLLATVHTGTFTSHEERGLMLNALKDVDSNPSRLLFCHVHQTFTERNLKTAVINPDSWKLNLDHAKMLLDYGANICLDLFGSPYDLEAIGALEVSDTVKMGGLIELIRQGYSDQIVIGADVFMKIQTRRYGGAGYCRLLNYVVPTLRLAGIGERDIQKVTIDNPARMLAY